MIDVKLTTESFASILSGVYVMTHEVDGLAIPAAVWMNLATQLSAYIPNWQYEIQTIESWVSTSLLITPLEILTVEDMRKMKDYNIYFEFPNGNVTLIIAGDIVWEDSTST